MKKEMLDKIRMVAIVELSPGKKEKILLLQEGADWVWMRGSEPVTQGKSIGEMRENLKEKYYGFPVRFVDFGFLYVLPERDEVGQYALFHQARSSYKVSNGVVFDPAWGYTYRVDFLSAEGRKVIEELEANVEP